MSESSLIKHLEKTIPNISIINNSPDVTNSASIKKIDLINHFNDHQLEKYLKTYKSYIKLSSFVEYMIYSNRSSNTKGLYHVYMPYIHEYYNISVDILGFPEYSDSKLIPSRIEYSILFGIQYFLNQNSYLKDKIKFAYQYKLDDKYFDAAIPDLKILLEIQEDKENHNDKESDNYKRLIAKFNEYYIVYFHESDLKKNQMSLKNFVQNKLSKIIYGAISYYKKEETLKLIRELYIEKLREDENEVNSLKINDKYKRIKVINESIEYFSSSSPVKKIMEKYIQNEITSKEKYFITLSDIYELYPDLVNNTTFKKEIKTNIQYTKISKNNVDYYPWSIISFVIIKYSDTVNDSIVYLKFLTELDELYKILINYNNDYLKECKINFNEVEEYFSKKESNIIKYYKDELHVKEAKLELYKSSLDTINQKFKLFSFFRSLNNILLSPFKKQSKKSIENILTSLNSVKETIELIPCNLSEFTAQKILGKSIIKEYDDFPYVYYPESNGVDYKQLYIELKSKLVSDSMIFLIVKEFCPFFNPDKIEVINKIMHIDTYKSLIVMDDAESDTESDAESDTESNIKSDAESDTESLGNLEEED